MKKKILKYCKLLGILTLINYAVTALVCLIGGKFTFFVYSDTLMKSTMLVAFMTIITYIYGFAKRSHSFRKKAQFQVKSKEEIEEQKEEANNITYILFGLAMTSIIGSAIAAIFA